MVRCYDCAQPIPDDQIVRRSVQTGTSLGRYARFYYHKVNLCPRCADQRDKARANAGFIILIVALSIGGVLLMGCVCSGLMNLIPGRTSTSYKITPTSQKMDTSYELAATVTLVNPEKRQIGLQHNGIAGRIMAGNNWFDLAPDIPWPSVQNGQKVICTVTAKNGKLLVTKVQASE
jgi:hypothetical protein